VVVLMTTFDILEESSNGKVLEVQVVRRRRERGAARTARKNGLANGVDRPARDATETAIANEEIEESAVEIATVTEDAKTEIGTATTEETASEKIGLNETEAEMRRESNGWRKEKLQTTTSRATMPLPHPAVTSPVREVRNAERSVVWRGKIVVTARTAVIEMILGIETVGNEGREIKIVIAIEAVAVIVTAIEIGTVIVDVVVVIETEMRSETGIGIGTEDTLGASSPPGHETRESWKMEKRELMSMVGTCE